ncbi:MAG: leucine-rich repeat domain-containing protein, partial [Clostridia bacterium]|nr:leucine-rich repeat domain-containing protein [Clostridia bacterium]
RGCTALTSITLSNGITEIGNNLLYNCTSLTTVTIPDGVTAIGGAVFRGCTSLATVILPSSLETIGASAFNGCKLLSDINYKGTFDQWNLIEVGSSNSNLTNASIHYNWIEE